MMLAPAILAATWSIFAGIMELGVYRPNVEAERYYREAAVLEAGRDPEAAATWKARAEETAQVNKAAKSRVVTALLLAILGAALGAAGLIFQGRRTTQPLSESAVLRGVSLTGAKVIWTAVFLAAFLYFIALVMLACSYGVR
jgi:hypothetical protein